MEHFSEFFQGHASLNCGFRMKVLQKGRETSEVLENHWQHYGIRENDLEKLTVEKRRSERSWQRSRNQAPLALSKKLNMG
mmetsp:Transcript_3927/g.16772  ORF Transcript_3927/g.16772 Transcript_3927/m.16772 type:complete len:80 (+) Transcript_3927:892-1131(+)